ncbi:MAG: ABC transporter permease [Pirellulaceae bacterium]
MLIGNRGKYLGIVFGVTFATLLIGQQASIFCGLMSLTTSQIRDIQGASIWVMDANVQFIDDVKPLSDTALYRVRGVEGVRWAVPLYKGISRARLPDGNFQQTILIGVDDASLVGAPREMIVGSLADLGQPESIIIDERGFNQLWPDEPLTLGKTFEMNDKRAVVVGVCKASRTFQTFPIVYTRYSRAIRYVPPQRQVLSFILAEPQPEADPRAVCVAIQQTTRLRALTRDEFYWQTIDYYLRKTGIPVNFGITVALGFLVGAAISGQTFYLFTIENLHQFGTLKALGASDGKIVKMILTQAAVIAAIGYSLGIGFAALFGFAVRDAERLAFFMPWQVPALTAVAVCLMVVLASLLSIRRVLVLEPAVVFRG